MKEKSLLVRLLYRARDLRSRELFRALERHAKGDVLDVGGWDFFVTAREHASFDTWTSLESDPSRALAIDDPRFRLVHGDGCAMELESGRFDTVLAIQVLEHVLEPLRMVDEIARVLRPGGHAILLVPQTSTTHLAPHYHANLSRWWIDAALARAGLELVEWKPLGGRWSSTASHLLFFFLQSARVEGMSDAKLHRRSVLFYLLWPFMALFALVAIPICLVLSLGDLTEEPNNHLVVARKRH